MYAIRGTNPSLVGTPRDYFWVVGTVAAVTTCGSLIATNYNAWGYIILLAIVALSTRVPPIPAIVAALLGSAVWDYFFVPPRFSFEGIHVEQGLLLLTYFVVALVGSQLTALKAASDRAKLLAKSEQLHQALLDSVAHELKTPLAVLRTATENLQTDSAQRREVVATEIREAVSRMTELVDNLLNQLRLDAGMVTARLDWCSTDEVVASAVKQARSRIAGRQLTLTVADDLPLMFADEAMLSTAIAQLLVNAAVHTAPSAQIAVDAGVDRARGMHYIRVSDNGQGVAPEVRDKLFQRFKHGKGSGLGLGLSIARGFAAAHGGDIAYETNPGSGSRFMLTIPVTSQEPPP
jgi:K+-sensing histidine kinase KdpD